MKRWHLLIMGLGLTGWMFTGTLLKAQEPQELQEDSGNVTVITSDRLVFDHGKQFAEFMDNVVVTDPSVHLKADYMKVWFNEDNEVDTIEARGNVYIQQNETEAWAGRAEYLMATGRMVLRDQPKMSRGRDLLTGDVITFFRDENRMIVEPRARLVIFPQDGEERPNLDITGGR